MRSLALFLLLGLTSAKVIVKGASDDGCVNKLEDRECQGWIVKVGNFCDDDYGQENCKLACRLCSQYFTLVDSSYGDPSVSSGQMGLLLYNGGTVCADGFGYNEANAICRDMGYGRAAAWTAEESMSTKYEDLVDIVLGFDMMLSEVRCTDENWSSCTHTTDATCWYPGAVFLACTTDEGCSNKYDEDKCQLFIDADGGCDRPNTQDSCKWTCTGGLCPGSESD